MSTPLFKNALVSVSDKTGLVEFLRPFAEQGLRIVSTGGTAEHLIQAGFKITPVTDQTDFPEVMGGRVKTLHPKVYMPLLAREQDAQILKEQGLERFDLVVVNLYPFEETPGIENIDIGGPSMIRAAAKNHEFVAVVTDPQDYPSFQNKKELTIEDRRRLAGKAFAHVSRYDSLISHYFGAFWGPELSFGGRKKMELRYGENPQQQAAWYQFSGDKQGLHTAEILQGKVLSYNNILDLEAATNLVGELGPDSCVVVKHNNPCGVAVDRNLFTAVQKSIAADPVSAFGGIVACGKEVDAQSADILSSLFLEVIIAPHFTKDAQEKLAKKKNLRLVAWPNILTYQRPMDIRSVAGGFLVQSSDALKTPLENWKYLGTKPSNEVQKDLGLAEMICGQLKSNSIAIVQGGQSKGLGMGQVNRVEAVAHAIERMQKHHPKIKGPLVLASDAFFPFADSIELIAKAGVTWIVQPGGSVKDEEVFQKAKDLGIEMVLTGQRHFRH